MGEIHASPHPEWAGNESRHVLVLREEWEELLAAAHHCVSVLGLEDSIERLEQALTQGEESDESSP